MIAISSHTMINNAERKILYKIAGDIIINRYEKYDIIPEKYKELYETYIPSSVGIKRKASYDAEQP
jgi:hypothetical protein